MNTIYLAFSNSPERPEITLKEEENILMQILTSGAMPLMPASFKKLDLDIITHSRGGLVGLDLCERQAPADGGIHVRRAVFVAGPHNGTILTDAQNWRRMIDAYTSLLTDLPDGPFTITLEGFLTLIKVVGAGALDGLPGLQSMLPGGDYLKSLNAAPKSNTTYYAMAAQYMPTDERALARFAKRLMMKALGGIFKEDSDLVVPTRGCYEMTPSVPGFSIPQDRHTVYDLETEINHLNFFQNQNVNKRLHDWLCTPA